MRMLIVFSAAIFLTGCSITVGTVNLSNGESKLKTKITQQKPVDVKTEAKVPVLP